MSYQYCTPAQVKLIAKPEIDITSQADEINALINGVSRWIDQYTKFPEQYFAGIGAEPPTFQKIRNEASGFIDHLSTGIFVAELTAADLEDSPRAVICNGTGGMASDSIAFEVKAALEADPVIDAFVTIEGTGNRVDLERKVAAVSDPTFSLNIRESSPPFAQVVESTFSTEIVAGSDGVAASVRRYRGENKPYLRVGPHVGDATITSPVISPSLVYVDRNGWIRYDDAITNQGDEDYFNDLRRDTFFSAGTVYQVSARWGFGETPDDIVTACALIVGDLLDRGSGVIGQISPSGFVIERTMPLAARDILNNNRKREYQAV